MRNWRCAMRRTAGNVRRWRFGGPWRLYLICLISTGRSRVRLSGSATPRGDESGHLVDGAGKVIKRARGHEIRGGSAIFIEAIDPSAGRIGREEIFAELH